jgi:ABC-type polysaccharide/polyol phosphate export permease
MNQLGVTYDPLYGYFQSQGHPEYIWYALTANVLLGIAAIYLFTKIAGEFHEQKE